MNDPKIAAICPARHVCKQHNKLCSTGCPWFIDLRDQITMAGIPTRHTRWNVDTLPDDTFGLAFLKAWSSKDIGHIADGDGLYLYGSVGTGKTTAALALAMSYIVHQTHLDIRQGKRSDQLVQFVNVPDLLDQLRRGFDNPELAAKAARTVESLQKVPLAIFDDIGAERPSPWVQERLLTAIGNRYDYGRSTIFTSNLNQTKLAVQLGERLQSRIEGMTVPLEFKGADRRKKA